MTRELSSKADGSTLTKALSQKEREKNRETKVSCDDPLPQGEGF
jgi:hypothetical protein